MPHFKKYLSLSIILGTSLAITGCIVSPPNQNQNNQYQPATNANNSYNNQNSTPVDVSDINNSSASYAEQQLQARGFSQTRSTPASSEGFSNSWWLNSKTKQCFQLETANGKVMTLNPRTSQDLPQFRCN
jgi:hypothetical protein